MRTAIPQTCFYCGKNIRRKNATRDHVQPTSRNGSRSKANQVWACVRCNQDKAHFTLEEFRLLKMFRSGLLKVPKAGYRFPGERKTQ